MSGVTAAAATATAAAATACTAIECKQASRVHAPFTPKPWDLCITLMLLQARLLFPNTLHSTRHANLQESIELQLTATSWCCCNHIMMSDVPRVTLPAAKTSEL
jgi:hypothetical protein